MAELPYKVIHCFPGNQVVDIDRVLLSDAVDPVLSLHQYLWGSEVAHTSTGIAETMLHECLCYLLQGSRIARQTQQWKKQSV